MKPRVIELPRHSCPHVAEAMAVLEALARLEFRSGQASLARAMKRDRMGLKLKAIGLIEHDRSLIAVAECVRAGGSATYRDVVAKVVE